MAVSTGVVEQLPYGVQIIVRSCREERCLEVVEAVEAVEAAEVVGLRLEAYVDPPVPVRKFGPVGR
ncbi:hypothetical protein ACIQU1_30280 [Streptomyces angustmyceticus]|uniref:hypothetical protein n=1 Tax=Streptomyces angustmyceticus TaxID=285578 RepID=UPI00344E76EB